MPLTMTRSIQLELAIDSDHRSRSAEHIDSQRMPRRVDSVQRRRRAQSQACGECGGPLVAGEGARTCVICGKSWRWAS